MIEAVALGPDGLAWSVTARARRRYVVCHARDGARVVYETADTLCALVVAGQRLHAFGDRHHWSHDGGASWSSGPSPVDHAMACWRSPSGTLVVVGDAGAVDFRHDDGAATADRDITLGLGTLFGVAGTADDDLWVVGEGRAIHHFDGRTWTAVPAPPGAYTLQAVCCRGVDDVWLVCASGGVYHGGRRGFVEVARVPGGELYGVGIGRDGVFVHEGFQVQRVEGSALVVVLEGKALMKRAGEYPTCMASDGVRVVAGGCDTVFVDEGAGFLPLPSGDPPTKTPSTKTPSTKTSATKKSTKTSATKTSATKTSATKTSATKKSTKTSATKATATKATAKKKTAKKTTAKKKTTPTR
jgi:hypothetical protein